jgi:hypothetical protein
MLTRELAAHYGVVNRALPDADLDAALAGGSAPTPTSSPRHCGQCSPPQADYSTTA